MIASICRSGAFEIVRVFVCAQQSLELAYVSKPSEALCFYFGVVAFTYDFYRPNGAHTCLRITSSICQVIIRGVGFTRSLSTYIHGKMQSLPRL